MKIIVVRDVPANPLDRCKNARYITWDSYSEAENLISIPRLVETESEKIREIYLREVFELGQESQMDESISEALKISKTFSFWWLTGICQKCNYARSPRITDSIKLIATEMIFRKEVVESVVCELNDKDLINAFTILCDIYEIELKIRFTGGVFRRLGFSNLKDLMPRPFLAFMWLTRMLIHNFSFRKQHGDMGISDLKEVTLFTYLLGDPETEDIQTDRYWNILPVELEKLGFRVNWVYIPTGEGRLKSTAKIRSWIHESNRSFAKTQSRYLLTDFLDFKVIMAAIFDWWKVICKGNLISRVICERSGVRYIVPLLLIDWYDSLYGPQALSNLIYFHLYHRILEAIPKQQLGIYLQENQSWEFCLVDAWRRHGHGRLIGYPHTTIKFWDLRYFFDKRSHDASGDWMLPMPDLVACNGFQTKNALLNNYFPEKKLRIVESLRYLHLLDHSSRSARKASEILRVLVIGDFLRSNTQKQLQLWSRALAHLSKPVEVRFRPHPGCDMKNDEYRKFGVTIATDSFDYLLRNCDCMYTGAASSAALDGYLAGLQIIAFLDGAILNLSPLRGFENVSFVSTEKQLSETIMKIGNHLAITPAERQEYFYLDRSLRSWKALATVED